MKVYDYKKARKIIKETDGVKSASLGMYEDWSWTAETVWEDGKFTKKLLSKNMEIAGLNGSQWATPTLELELENGEVRMIECFTGKSESKKPEYFSLGVISGPTQDRLPVLEKNNI